jgi:hypothetical protein
MKAGWPNLEPEADCGWNSQGLDLGEIRGRLKFELWIARMVAIFLEAPGPARPTLKKNNNPGMLSGIEAEKPLAAQ